MTIHFLAVSCRAGILYHAFIIFAKTTVILVIISSWLIPAFSCDQPFSIALNSGEFPGHSEKVILLFFKNFIALWYSKESCIKILFPFGYNSLISGSSRLSNIRRYWCWCTLPLIKWNRPFLSTFSQCNCYRIIKVSCDEPTGKVS